MTKEEKALYTNMFFSDEEYEKCNPHIMCTTSGIGNAGIDSSKISVVYRLGMPESISGFYQEKGCSGCNANALAMENCYVLCFSIEDFIYLYRRTMDPDESILNKDFRLMYV